MSRQVRTVRVEDSGVVQALEPRDLSLEETLGKYRLLGTLGHGGMADVYLAVADGPEGFRKLCVLKTLKDSMAQDEDFRAMTIVGATARTGFWSRGGGSWRQRDN